MTLSLPPESGDADTMAALTRLIPQAASFIQVHGGLMALTMVFAWALGIDKGLHGRVLFVKVVLTVIIVFVLVPFVMWRFMLPQEYGYPLAIFIGWRGPSILSWGEALIFRKFGFTAEEVKAAHNAAEDGTSENREDRS